MLIAHLLALGLITPLPTPAPLEAARDSGVMGPRLGWDGVDGGPHGVLPVFWAPDLGWDVSAGPGWGPSGFEGWARLRWASSGAGALEIHERGAAWASQGEGELRLGQARLQLRGAFASSAGAWSEARRGLARHDERLLSLNALSLNSRRLGLTLRQTVERDLIEDQLSATPALVLGFHSPDGLINAGAELVPARRPWLRALADLQRRQPLGPLDLEARGGVLSLSDTDAERGRWLWLSGATEVSLPMGRAFGAWWHQWRLGLGGAWGDGWRRGDLKWLAPEPQGRLRARLDQRLEGPTARVDLDASLIDARRGPRRGRWLEVDARVGLGEALSLHGVARPWRRAAALRWGEARHLSLGLAQLLGPALVDDLHLFALEPRWRGEAVTLEGAAGLWGALRVEGALFVDPTEGAVIAWRGGVLGGRAWQVGLEATSTYGQAAPDLFAMLRFMRPLTAGPRDDNE